MPNYTTSVRRPLTDDQVRAYETDGYLILPGMLGAEQLAAMLDECMRAWRAERGAFDPNATWLKNALLPDIHPIPIGT